MKTLRLIIGILSCALVLIVLFQSCAATVVTSVGDNQDDVSGAAGVVFAIIILSAGITTIAGRNSKGATIAATVLYLLAALIGFIGKGVYQDLQVWAFIALAFGVLFAISMVTDRPKAPVYEVKHSEPMPEPEKQVYESAPTAVTIAAPIVGMKPKDPWFVSAIRISGIVEAVVGVFLAVIYINHMPPEKLANMYLYIKETRYFLYGVSGVAGILWILSSFIIASVVSDVHAMRVYLSGYTIK